MDIFAPGYKINGCFVVQNISPQIKTISIFQYPINYGYTRDLLAIPGVAEQDIRASLLKGELNNKIRVGDITVICSDIDLLQFNANQKLFLEEAGIVNGLSVSNMNFQYVELQDITLLGTVDSVNTNFTVPSGVFIQNSTYKIIVYLNGVKQSYLNDYTVSESGGFGTGYDTVIFNIPPGNIPSPPDLITADYWVNNL